MQAVLWRKFGGAEVLEIGEFKKPRPKPDEILVKIKAFTVNRTDCALLKSSMFIMRLQTGLFKPNQPILGTDFAGVVEEVGSEVNRFSAGDRVFGFDDTGILSHAEYMVIKAKNAIGIIPENVNFETAAASIEGPHYAENIINKVDFKEGDTVFIHGATGGIGSATLQHCKLRGGIVTASCRTEHIDLIKQLGADKVVDYTNDDYLQLKNEFNYVFDAVGKSTFGKFKPLLKSGGTYISSELGPGAQNIFLALITPVLGGKKVKFPIPFNKQRSVDMMADLLAQGKYTPLIDRTYTLDQTPEAFGYVLKGQKVGNVVVTVK